MHRTAIAAAALFAAAAGPAFAACKAPASADDLTRDQAAAVYDCLKAEMQEGYAKGPKRWVPKAYVDDYRSWTAASAGPAAPGVHGDRFLMTWVNAAGAETYLKYEDEGVSVPAGTVIAKESFSVGKDGTARPGPLFIMEKVRKGKSPATNDWYYMMVAPNGVPQAVPVEQACHACHSGYEGSDGLGYPVEEARVR